MKQTSSSDPLTIEPTGIIEAMNIIVRHSEGSGLTDKTFSDLEKPISYLCNRLQINERQAVLLSVVCECAAEASVTITRLAEFFGCSNLNSITFIKDLDELIDKRLLKVGGAMRSGAKSYNVPWDMLTAYSNNEVYNVRTHFNTCEELLSAIESMSNEYDEFSFNDFYRQLKMMLEEAQATCEAKCQAEGLDFATEFEKEKAEVIAKYEKETAEKEAKENAKLDPAKQAEILKEFNKLRVDNGKEPISID